MAERARPRASTKAPSQRMLRVGELIRRVLADVLARGDLHVPELSGKSITIGEVRTSPDLRQATVYVMPLGGADREVTLEALAKAKGELKRAVMREVRLKYAPDLRFVLDESFDRMDETRALFADERVRRDLDD
ncbi:MAG: 30S ribosome-binding factor RbfA [Pseudomonadota bacterium]